MAPSRKVLFVAYAIGSWVYRWVVMFSILWMLADFLGPKLKILSQMLAMLSLASLFIWPAYKVIKNIRQRGRLPDMKAARVYITLFVFTLLIVGFFLLPLPVSRVHETGLVLVAALPSRLIDVTAVSGRSTSVTVGSLAPPTAGSSVSTVPQVGLQVTVP